MLHRVFNELEAIARDADAFFTYMIGVPVFEPLESEGLLIAAATYMGPLLVRICHGFRHRDDA